MFVRLLARVASRFNEFSKNNASVGLIDRSNMYLNVKLILKISFCPFVHTAAHVSMSAADVRVRIREGRRQKEEEEEARGIVCHTNYPPFCCLLPACYGFRQELKVASSHNLSGQRNPLPPCSQLLSWLACLLACPVSAP